MWLTLFISISFAFAFLVLQINLQYFEYSVITNTNILRELATPFPTVTVCDYNLFSTPEGTRFLNDALSKSDTKFLNKNLDRKSRIKKIQLEIKYAKSFLLANKTIYNNTELRKKFSLTLDKMMVSCYFGSKICNENDFEYFSIYKINQRYKLAKFFFTKSIL